LSAVGGWMMPSGVAPSVKREVEILLAQGLVHAQQDTLDAREAVRALGARGLARVVHLVARVAAGGHAIDELLVGGVWQTRRAAIVVQ
jgi:hypothetical protein